MATRTLLETSAVLDVPASVAVCPYCGDLLYVQFSAWSQRDDGTWAADSIELECVSEPEDLSSDEWWGWMREHTYMPYVYWLPVDLKVTKWVNANYDFDMERKPMIR